MNTMSNTVKKFSMGSVYFIATVLAVLFSTTSVTAEEKKEEEKSSKFSNILIRDKTTQKENPPFFCLR